MAMNTIKSFQNLEKSDKSKLMAFWLCIIFGPFGLHRLYVGKIISGLCMLVPSIISSVWIYRTYNNLSTMLDAALTGTDQTQQLINNLTAAGSSSWNDLLSWVTIALLIWTVIDLVLISSGKFTDNEGRIL
jgi:TM2 domain-containing membrane protein YozV